MTVTVMQPTYKRMCYDMPVPICNQAPCMSQGMCGPGTNACSNVDYTTSVTCPLEQAGQRPQSPNAVGGCQQVH